MRKKEPHRNEDAILLYQILDALQDEIEWVNHQLSLVPGEEVDYLNGHALMTGNSKNFRMHRILNSFRSESEIQFDRLLSKRKWMEKHKNMKSPSSPHFDEKTNLLAAERRRQRCQREIDAINNKIEALEFEELNISSNDQTLKLEIEKLFNKEVLKIILEIYQVERAGSELEKTIDLKIKEGFLTLSLSVVEEKK